MQQWLKILNRERLHEIRVELNNTIELEPLSARMWLLKAVMTFVRVDIAKLNYCQAGHIHSCILWSRMHTVLQSKA